MSFSLETTDMDLGDTPIENIFINDYMPMANGTYVKVYLLGFKYAHDKDGQIEVNNETIAKHLNISLEDILGAWDFWEGKGIIEKLPIEEGNKVNFKVRFLNLKQLYIKNNFGVLNQKEETKKPKQYSTKDLIDANQIPSINNMFNAIDNIMRRQMVPTEKQRVLGWIHDYNMNPDVIEKAFFYAVERKGKKQINYIEGIIRNWYDDGLTNLEAIAENFKLKDEKYYRYQQVMKSLGLDKRPITEGEMVTIDKWFGQYGLSLELVLKGCESSSKVSNPTINYIDGVISSWHKKGIKTIEDIELMDAPKEKKDYKVKNTTDRKYTPAKTRFHNFEQRTDQYSSDELEAIAKKKREAHNQRLKGE